MCGVIIVITTVAGTFGRVGSRRFPIEEDDHLLTVLRYVERNPVRAKLVRMAAETAVMAVEERKK
jgi:hypothetical protein